MMFLNGQTEQKYYLPVLTYHLVDPSIVDENSVPPEELAEQMDRLTDLGYVFRSLPDVTLDKIGGEKQVIITFDDAYASTMEYANKILTDRSIPYTVFVPTDYIGSDNLWNKKAKYICSHLSWKDLQSLMKMGITIGSHSCSHHSLVKFPQEKLEYEFCHSKEVLEDFLGTPVIFFAYPYGDTLPSFEKITCQWYRFAFSAWQGYGNWKAHPYSIHRTLIKRSQTMDQILVEMEAGNDSQKKGNH